MVVHLCNKHFTFNLEISESLEKFSHYVAETFVESAVAESLKKKKASDEGNQMDVKYLSWEWEWERSAACQPAPHTVLCGTAHPGGTRPPPFGTQTVLLHGETPCTVREERERQFPGAVQPT